ncbi:DMSO/TMAO reductase YedYZ molybdopterin-dependent catalytic subunit [Flavobacterium nitrogenifigens]|uniref:DMSO/TMAO reductase YedYZ molybdopterin-dependent catalytic subunit n=2 Tax=Flavobacterium TaxID=237 RepID=A0A7W7IZ92_9FLAO|nr:MULTISPECIES: molybdopterin-dependent oxidoreductase [Flavobacterium]MBB4802620.1 DMSO/TMAO reductase YedYZ molybdopterin-dependent catalytic subunit [Flavobacterium nitrogenifigens]MBB6387578.1 DMSO/TMAO reductase YedYZ molybdopterin-dependent catalytic subunit [Flavobacterium notoginsengisoli]
MKKHFLSLILATSLFFVGISNDLLAQNSSKEPVVKVEGEVLKTLSLSLSDLAKMPHVQATMKNREGKLQEYSGVPIIEILKQAGVTLGKELKGENLTKYMLVRGSDGYEVIFSLAELDPAFTNRVIILADKKDGKPLEDGVGPFRLVVPEENRPARSVLEVSHLIIKFAKE